MEWEVEVTGEFEKWWDTLSDGEQEDMRAVVLLLGQLGPSLPFPFSSGVKTSRHPHMRELRIQHAGEPYRILYAFDPRRTAILLIGGRKTGNNRWHKSHVPIADRLYDHYLAELRKERLIDG